MSVLFNSMLLAAETPYVSPTFVAAQSAQGSGTSRAVTVPTVSAGNLVVAVMVSNNTSDVWSPPAGGWALVDVLSALNFSAAIYKKAATGSEGSSYTFTGSVSSTYWVEVSTYSGATTVSANNLPAVSVGNADPLVAASMSVAKDRILQAVAMSINNVTLTSGPSGMTSRVNNFASGSLRGAMFDLVNPATGASGTKSFDVSGTTYGAAFLLEIQ